MPEILANVAIQQGSTMVFSHYDSAGPMWTAAGPREVREDVRFDAPFAATPTVHLSITLWDVENSANLRVDISADNVTETGFTIVVRTWDDTRIARLGASWIALGAAPDPDRWNLD